MIQTDPYFKASVAPFDTLEHEVDRENESFQALISSLVTKQHMRRHELVQGLVAKQQANELRRQISKANEYEQSVRAKRAAAE